MADLTRWRLSGIFKKSRAVLVLRYFEDLTEAETAAALADRGWQAIALDLRGHGESGWSPGGDYQIARFAEDMVAVARDIGGSPALIGASAALALSVPAQAQQIAWSTQTLPAPSQPGAVVLPSVPAGTANEEYWFHEIVPGGTEWSVRNITVPTLVPILPVGDHTGAAIIVAPGGGFLGLAIEKEGWDVARWLANHGITAFVLKYRVIPTPVDQPTFVADVQSAMSGGPGRFTPPADTPPEALADGLAALRWVREHAAEYGIDPTGVGRMLGLKAMGEIKMAAQAGAATATPSAPVTAV